MTSFSSVHFVCFGEERNMNKCASTSWSSCLWNHCELVSNIEEQLRIVFMYTGNLFHLHDLAIWKWLKKCVHKHIKENKANCFFYILAVTSLPGKLSDMTTSIPDSNVLDLNQEQQLTRHASLLKIIQTNLVCDIVR
jgi:hypothetical protein